MIEKIKEVAAIKGIKTSQVNTTQQETTSIGVNNQNNYMNNNHFVEELDLTLEEKSNNDYSNDTPITEEKVLNAISENFEKNKKLTSQMNDKVYKVVKERLNEYLKSNGGNLNG